MPPSKSWSSLWAERGSANWRLTLAIHIYRDYIMATATADFQRPWKEFRMKVKNDAFCALGKTGKTDLQIDLFKRFYESQFLHLLIPRKTLTSLMVPSALAIKNFLQLKVKIMYSAMVQTSWKINRCYYGCNFRLDIVLLNTWVFWVVSGLDATILKTMSFEFFYKTKAPTQVEDGNFRLNIRFLKHSSVAWPPANHPSGASCFWGPVMTILLGLLFGPCLFYLWEAPTVSN